MIDTNETLLRVPTEAAKAWPAGNPHSSTIWRFHRRGIKGVRLETICVGGRRYTSKEAISRFIARVTAADQGTPAARMTPKSRARSIERAERELDAAGI